MKTNLKIVLYLFIYVVTQSCNKENQPPYIQKIASSPQIIKTGENTQITCIATDADGDDLTYTWAAAQGLFPNGNIGESVVWKAPEKPDKYVISVFVSDGKRIVNGNLDIMVEANPVLSGIPTAMDFGTTFTQQSFNIANAGTGTLNWTISNSETWLSVSTFSGEVSSQPQNIIVTVNRAGILPGNYSDKITILSNGGNKEINVLMKVPEPILNVSSTILDFGITTIRQSIDISNTGIGTLNWTLSKNASWLSVSTYSGSSGSLPKKIILTVNRAGISPGNYSDIISILSNGGSKEINIDMRVSETIQHGSIIDTRDNRMYITIKIGKQTWMAENLAYLPSVSPSNEGSKTVPYYYVYGYQGSDITSAKETDNYKYYGVLYNWPAALAGSASSSSNPSNVQGICPAGWHLPSDEEWKQLENYLIANGFNYDGTTTDNKIAKSLAATTDWQIQWQEGVIGTNLSLNNKSGFSALPGGGRTSDFFGVFLNFGSMGFWWKSNEFQSSFVSSLALSGIYEYSTGTYTHKDLGYSVRCVKD